MRTITRSNYTLTAYDEAVYLQERMLINFTRTSGTATTVQLREATSSALGSVIATYRLNADGEVTIDVTDYLRAFKPAYIGIWFDSDANIMANTFAGLINPQTAYIPRAWHWDDDGIIIPPPSVIYRGTTQGILSVHVQSNTHTYEYQRVYESGSASGWISLSNGQNSIYLQYATIATLRFRKKAASDESWTYFQDINLRPLNECREYVVIRWVERFANKYKAAVFVRTRNTYETQDAIELENVKNEYTVRKGFEQSFVASLNDIMPYDVWYYGDIINSSVVQVLSEGGEWVRVDVSTKSVEIPDTETGAPKSFEFEVKYRRYDAI